MASVAAQVEHVCCWCVVLGHTASALAGLNETKVGMSTALPVSQFEQFVNHPCILVYILFSD